MYRTHINYDYVFHYLASLIAWSRCAQMNVSYVTLWYPFNWYSQHIHQIVNCSFVLRFYFSSPLQLQLHVMLYTTYSLFADHSSLLFLSVSLSSQFCLSCCYARIGRIFIRTRRVRIWSSSSSSSTFTPMNAVNSVPIFMTFCWFKQLKPRIPWRHGVWPGGHSKLVSAAWPFMMC